ncbi:MAG: hypothetical protein B6D35_04145 [Candidatus Brocadia sp. UTAMX2]|nr:MAG: hypothetical protein B6D35_04145 [Candidatus Brocadia sp. UTAMX2]
MGYWDIYYREHVEYYAYFVKRWGVPEGIGRVPRKRVSHRYCTFKFYRRGHVGVITRVEAINGCGKLNTGHYVGSFIAGWKSEDDLIRECIWEFEPKIRKNDRDDPVNEIARNRKGEICWIFHFRPHKADSNVYLAEYTTEIGRRKLRGYSEASFVEFVRTEEGFDELIRYFDEKGNPQPDNDGSFKIHYIFNKHGQPLSVTYLNFDGRPVLNKYGIAIEEVKYDECGNIIEVACFDEAGNPIRRNEGFAIMKNEYDERGNQTEEAYFDEAGNPIRLKGDYAIVKMEYDERGNQTEQAYFDEAGNPIRLKGDYAIVKMEYDERGNKTEQAYFDEEGKPIRHKDGYAIEKVEYDERGNIREVAYFDEAGNPIRLKGDYAIVKMEYDERGNKTEQAYFDEEGKPTRNKDGYTKVTASYNEKEKITERGYFGLLDPDFSTMIQYFDSDGKLLKGAYYLEDKLKFIYLYDKHGNKIEEVYFDEKGKPTRNQNGYAIGKMKYDERGNKTEQAYFDEEDKPTQNKYGYSKVRWKYNEHDNQIEDVLYLDTHGRKVQTHLVIVEVMPDGQGAKVGLQPRDIIVSYDGKKARYMQTFIQSVKSNGTKPRTLDIMRNGEKMSFQVNPGLIGILLEDRGVSASR